MYLALKSSEPESKWDEFQQKFLIIFQPFSEGSWLVIMFCMCPFLAIVLKAQERGIPNSDFPAKENCERTDSRKYYPNWKNMNRALYRSFHSYLTRFYGHPVQTYGATWTVLAFCFIGMIGMSLYTAQMASHLTEEALKPSIESLEQAVRSGFRFCGERKSVDNIMDLYNIHSLFVVDPVEEGGDGKPGFNCAKCGARKRTLDFLDPVKANHDERYCHAAIVEVTDLEKAQDDELHCNKILVGQPLAYVAIGFPLSNENADRLRSLFLTVKNAGVYEEAKNRAAPKITCSNRERKSGAHSLGLYDLIGIWICTLGFAIIGICISIYERRYLYNL